MRATALGKVLLMLVAFTAMAQQSGDVTQIPEIATRTVNAYRGWGPQLNNAGASLQLKETSRKGGTVTFRLYETGLPRDEIYAIIQWPVTQADPSVMLDGVTFNDAGLAICAGRPGTCGDPAEPDDPIDLTFPAPVKGEPFRLGVGSDANPRIRAVIKLVPVPNEADDNGCHLDAVLLMPHAELVLIEGSNLPPNSDLTLSGDSEGEVHSFTDKSDPDGNYLKALLPAKAGLKSGTIKVRLDVKGCHPQLSIPWSCPRCPTK